MVRLEVQVILTNANLCFTFFIPYCCILAVVNESESVFLGTGLSSESLCGRKICLGSSLGDLLTSNAQDSKVSNMHAQSFSKNIAGLRNYHFLDI